MKTTLQEKFLDSPVALQMFSERQAKDIYIGQQFRFSNGRFYTVENVYVSNGVAKINVGYDYFPGMGTAPAWFCPGDGFLWIQDSLGVGMQVIIPMGVIATIETILPNRVCSCLLNNGNRKSFLEKDLKQIEHGFK